MLLRCPKQKKRILDRVPGGQQACSFSYLHTSCLREKASRVKHLKLCLERRRNRDFVFSVLGLGRFQSCRTDRKASNAP